MYIEKKRGRAAMGTVPDRRNEHSAGTQRPGEAGARDGDPLRLLVISCRVMSRELRSCASRSIHHIDIRFLHQGLHEFPDRLNRTVTAELAAADESYDYILLNYGVCGNGTLSLSHPAVPLAIHQVHDCIPLLVGDRDRHARCLAGHPGTFWLSPGWIEGFPLPGAPDYVEKYREHYGREVTARQQEMIDRVLMENYDRLMYVHWESLGEELARRCRSYARSCARTLTGRLGRRFAAEEMQGSPDLLQRFVDVRWDERDVLVVPPGRQVRLDHGTARMYAVRVPGPGD